MDGIDGNSDNSQACQKTVSESSSYATASLLDALHSPRPSELKLTRNNARIIGSSSRIIGQNCENMGIEL